MNELRHDPLQRRWVIIASHRRQRPSDYRREVPVRPPGPCSFCEGHEGETPPELLAIRQEGGVRNGPGWRVRVVPNRFPVLAPGDDVGREMEGLHERLGGIGDHEVVIESPDHGTDPSRMSVEHLATVLRVCRERLVALAGNPRSRYVLLFRNHGEAGGASLGHPHSQIISMPIMPQEVATEASSSEEHYRARGRCLLCDIIADEIEEGRRIVYRDDRYVAFAPFASRFPFEVRMAPLGHRADFEGLPDEDLPGVAAVLGEILSRLRLALEDPPYNLVLHTSPRGDANDGPGASWRSLPQSYHWHFELLPRLTTVAGFEWGAGIHINPAPPGEAARLLREARA